MNKKLLNWIRIFPLVPLVLFLLMGYAFQHNMFCEELGCFIGILVYGMYFLIPMFIFGLLAAILSIWGKFQKTALVLNITSLTIGLGMLLMTLGRMLPY